MSWLLFWFYSDAKSLDDYDEKDWPDANGGDYIKYGRTTSR